MGQGSGILDGKALWVEADFGSRGVHASSGPRELCCFPASFQGLESHSSCSGSSGNLHQAALVFNVHLLLSVSVSLSIPFPL